MWWYWLMDKLNIQRAVWLRDLRRNLTIQHRGTMIMRHGELYGYLCHASGHKIILLPDGRIQLEYNEPNGPEWWYAWPRDKDAAEYMKYKALNQ
jgi:hypothetical protein